MAAVGLVIDRTDPKEDGFSPPNQCIDQSPTPSPSYCCLEKFPHIFDMTLRAAVSATLWHSPWPRTLKINCYHSTIRNPKHLSHAWVPPNTDCTLTAPVSRERGQGHGHGHGHGQLTVSFLSFLRSREKPQCRSLSRSLGWYGQSVRGKRTSRWK